MYDDDQFLTFDDVLIKPMYSELNSRSEVDLSTDRFSVPMTLPVFSSNMATVTEHEMCKAIREAGGLGVYHRFMDHKTNVQEVAKTNIGYHCAVSVGLGKEELKRAELLIEVGAKLFFLDVAHGAQKQVALQYKALKKLGCEFVVVGNFGDSASFEDWNSACNLDWDIDGIKVGIGPGSVCTTRIKTGVGVPQISAIQSFADLFDWDDRPAVIADGGMRTPGDIAKALAAGADAVMLGGMLAGTDETPGELIPVGVRNHEETIFQKQYSGSAHKTGEEGYSTSEGESITVPYKGSVVRILNEIEGGIRSAFTYVGAKNIKEFHERAELLQVSSSTRTENGAHYGK